MRRIVLLPLALGLLSVVAGCQNRCDRRPLFGCREPEPRPTFVTPLPPTSVAPTAVAPTAVPAPSLQPAGGFPVAPAGPAGNLPVAPPTNQPPPSISNAAPGGTPWQSPQGQSPPGSSEPPRIDTQRESKERIQLYAPETIEKEKPATKPGVFATMPPIAQFAVVEDNRILTGLRPKLDGLDWLKANGVKTVLNLRLPDQDDSTDRAQIEKRNMRYLVLDVSPTTLTRERADEFIKLIRDGSKESIFVYDENGALAGAMWYLYMRLAIPLEEDASQLNARQLGLQANREGLHRDMWLAARRVLGENTR